jgi:hypothetical protein
VGVLAAVPALPGAACPAAASALASAGLGPVCQVASGVSGLAGSAASQVAGFGVDSVLGALGGWVADGATWLLAQVGSVLGDTTRIDLGASWFAAHYETMAALAGVVVVPFLLLGIVQSVYRQSASSLLRSVLVNVPLAVLLTAVAVQLVQLGLSVTDALSSAVAQGAGLDTGHFLSTVTVALSGAPSGDQPAAPAFVLFVGALAVVVGAMLVWVELLIRAAAVYVAVLFLPLALASLAWPAIAHWCRRLVDTLASLIVGKFVIVSVLSLSVGALAGGTGSTPSGAASGSSGGGGFTAVLGGAALLLLAALAPWAVFRLLPFVEAGAAGHLEALSHRAGRTATVPMRSLAQTAMRLTASGALSSAGAGMVGGATGGSLAGGVMGRSGGSPGAGGNGSGGGAAAAPVGVVGSPAGGPDLGPSSATTTGVGTVDPPGHGIPMWSIHPEATAAANGYGPGPVGEAGAWGSSSAGPVPPDAGTRAGGATSSGDLGLQPLPRQTGALRADALGRDELGIKLVAAPTSDPPWPPWQEQPGG